MGKFNTTVKILLVAFLLLFIYRFIFFLQPIAGGDYITFFPENITFWLHFSFSLWDPLLDLGWSIIPLQAYAPYSSLIGVAGLLFGNNVIILERLFWWIPFLCIGFAGSFLLVRKVLKNTTWSLLAAFLFLTNTYILLLLAGGQITGVGMAYAFSPFVLLSYFYLLEKLSFKRGLITGICVSVSLMFDLRLSYIVLCGVYFYILYSLIWDTQIKEYKKMIRDVVLYACVVPGVITILLHAFWLLPLVMSRQNPLSQLGSVYTSLRAVKFFSFGTFEQALGLLHPNWPDNIFGKVGFMQPGFLLFPLIAFSSLFFINTKSKREEAKYVLFFALLGIFGVFLAKGANEPFGLVYLWLFAHIAGFIMFRDPTKWYLLVIFSYMILIPYALNEIGLCMNKKLKINYLGEVLFIGILIYCLVLIKPALFGELSGTFARHTIPSVYTKLTATLKADHHFSRVLWMPTTQRFGYYSITHPEISGYDLFHVSSEKNLIHVLTHQKDLLLMLQQMAVKYVIVPDDSDGEIFVTNNKYDNHLYIQMIHTLKNLSYVKEISGFGTIRAFVVPNPKDHFFLNRGGSVTYNSVDPTKYDLTLHDVQKGEVLVFSEAYSPSWELLDSAGVIESESFNGSLNQFVLPKSGSYRVVVFYKPQAWLDGALWITIASAVILCVICIVFYLKVALKDV